MKTTLSGQCPSGGAVFVNELYNNVSIEYTELVVVGDPANPTSPVNLEGWIIDDNNIDQAGQGTATGHLKLDNQFSSVNPGAIILIYNESNPYTPLPANNPPWLYVVSGSDLDGCSSSPSTSNPNYAPCGTSGGSWGYVALANTGDIIQTRNSSSQFYHGLRFNSVNVMPDVNPLDVPDIIGLDCGDWFNASNYTITTQSPGTANSAANQLLINSIRNGTLNCSNISLACNPPCPVIGDISVNPDAVCEDNSFSLTASGLQNMAQILNTVTNYGIEFVIHAGATAPADPYSGGTSLGIVPFANLTGTHPNQTASLNNISSTSFAAGQYWICAILNPTPANQDCQVFQCLPFTISPSPTASLGGTFEFCPGDCYQIDVQITGGSEPYQANFSFQSGPINIPFTVPGYDVNNQLIICYSGASPFPGYDLATNTLTVPTWLTGTGSMILNNIISADGCSASVINPNNTTLTFKGKNNISVAGPLQECDNDFDGEGVFDLTTLEATLISGQSNVSANWYEDSNCTVQISNPGSFSTAGTSVYVFLSHNQDEKCNSDTLEIQLIVIEVPNPGESNSINVCNTDDCVNFWIYLGPDAVQTGTWSDDDGTGVDLTFPHCVEFTGILPGVYSFTYTTQDGNGDCEATAVLTIELVNSGFPGDDNFDVFCGIPLSPVNIEAYLNNNFDSGGTWSTSGPFNMSNPNNVDMSAATLGTYYFYYEIINSPCLPVRSIITIQIVDQPNPGNDSTIFVCNSGQSTFADLVASLGPHDLNGVWTDVNGTGVDLSNPQNVDFEGVPIGLYDFYYTIPENGSCDEVDATITVSVSGGSFAGTDGSSEICYGTNQLIDLYIYLGTAYDQGGNWTQLTGAFISLSDPHNVSFYGKPVGAYNFQYSVTSSCGTDIAIVTIVINPAQGAGDNYNLTICQNSIISLYDSLKNYLLGGYWIDENNNQLINPVSVVLDQVKTYTFKYIFPGSSGCPNDTSIATIVSIAGVNAGNDGSLIICQGTQGNVNLFSYIGQTYTSGGSWWNVNNGNIISSPSVVDFSSAPVGLDTFMYIISGNCGKDTSYVIINIAVSPSAGTDYSVTACQNSTFNLFENLKNYSPGGNWIDADNVKINDPQKIMLTESKTYTFKYIIPASGGCLPDTAIAQVIVLPAPSAGVASDFSLCQGTSNPVNFFDHLTGNYTVGGTWKFNAAFTVPNPTNYSMSDLPAGIYNYSYIVAGNGNCPGDTSGLKVTIMLPPNAGSDANTNVCNSNINNIINLDNLIGIHDNNGVWKKQQSNPVNINNPKSVNFNNIPAGTYNFIYKINSNGICPADSSIVTITVFKKLTAGNDKTLSFCENDNTRIKILEELKPDLNTEYIIEDIQQTQSVITQSLEIDLSKLNPGTFRFRLVVGKDHICGPDSSMLTINIIKLKTAGTNNNLTVCNDETNVNIDNLLGVHDQGGNWTDMDNSGVQVQSSGGKNVSFLNVPKGKYRYMYSHSASTPCPESNAIITISVNPVTRFTLTREICSGENILVNGKTYNLSNPTGTEIINNTYGCDSIITIDLKPKAVSVNVRAEDENCFGFGKLIIENLTGTSLPASLTIDGTGTYQITNMPFTVSNLAAGNYTYDITDPKGCNIMDKNFVIKDFVPFNIAIDAVQLEDSYKLTVNTTITPDKISWTPAEGLSCDDCLITFAKPLGDQQYIVEISDKEGCKVLDTILLKRIINLELDIPNIFSPDGDGRNDKFYARCNDCNYIYTLHIFDRWGEKVFYAENIKFNDNTAGWDGRFREKKLNPGVYVYIIEIDQGNGDKELIGGDLLLVR
ncbi:MAG: gliding motility-associated C-terminal domain-containing protein [Deltaproteobacteria bacterium]